MKYTALALIGLCAVIVGCRPPIVDGENRSKFDYVVARVDTLYEIRMSDLYDSLYNSRRFPQGGVISVDSVQELLHRMIADSLTGFEADNVDLDGYYSERRLYKKRCNTFLARAFWDEMVHSKLHFDSLMAYQFYQDSSHLFEVNEQVLVHHILISELTLKRGEDSAHFFPLSPEEFEKEGLAYAKRLKAMVDEGQPFDQVAADYSHEQNAATNRGQVGWAERGVYLDPFDSVAFSTPPGTVTEPYRDKDGWHILYIERHMPAGVPPWDEQVYRSAMQVLQQTTVQSHYDAMVDSLNSLPQDIQYNEPLLDTNVFLVDKQEWFAVINGLDTVDIADMQALELDLRKKYHVPNTDGLMKQEGVQNNAAHYVLLEVARDLKIDTLPRVREAFAELRHRHCKNVAELERLGPSWTPSEDEVRAYYDAHIQGNVAQKSVEMRYLIVPDSTFAVFLLDQAEAGLGLADLAREFGSDNAARRVQLVDPGWASAEDVPPEVWLAGDRTLAGHLSPPVRGASGEYYLIEVIDREDPIVLSRVAPEIRDLLKRQHMRSIEQQYRDRLFTRYHVTFPNEVRPINAPPLSERH